MLELSLLCRVARVKPAGEKGPEDRFASVGGRCCRRRDEREPARARAPPLPPWLRVELPAPVGLLALDGECPGGTSAETGGEKSVSADK